MKPIKNYVLVKKIPFGERKYGSIIIPETAELEELDKPRLAIVLEVGNKCREVKPMDKVLIQPGVGMELDYQPDKGMMFDDEIWDAVILTEDNIMCVIETLKPEEIGNNLSTGTVNIEPKSDFNDSAVKQVESYIE